MGHGVTRTTHTPLVSSSAGSTSPHTCRHPCSTQGEEETTTQAKLINRAREQHKRCSLTHRGAYGHTWIWTARYSSAKSHTSLTTSTTAEYTSTYNSHTGGAIGDITGFTFSACDALFTTTALRDVQGLPTTILLMNSMQMSSVRCHSLSGYVDITQRSPGRQPDG